MLPQLLTLVSLGSVGRVGAPDARPVHTQPNGQPKIKHLVVMLMENRAADHFFGCMAGEGVVALDGINGSHYLPKDPNNASAGGVNVTCGTANYGDAQARCRAAAASAAAPPPTYRSRPLCAT
eukprot:COSAG05_NODE_507_length_9159_cov_53.489183_3_plen_123_part_00